MAYFTDSEHLVLTLIHGSKVQKYEINCQIYDQWALLTFFNILEYLRHVKARVSFKWKTIQNFATRWQHVHLPCV